MTSATLLKREPQNAARAFRNKLCVSFTILAAAGFAVFAGGAHAAGTTEPAEAGLQAGASNPMPRKIAQTTTRDHRGSNGRRVGDAAVQQEPVVRDHQGTDPGSRGNTPSSDRSFRDHRGTDAKSRGSAPSRRGPVVRDGRGRTASGGAPTTSACGRQGNPPCGTQ